MEKYIKISIGIFLALAASRFIPHPPNFTNLIALSFYIPLFFGLRFIPAVILGFAATDIFIGFHNTIFFTWGSVFMIGILSNFFSSVFVTRISGALLGAVIFFIISNFGVWTGGMYGYSFEGLISCFVLAIPFFGYTMLSTFLYALLIEIIINVYNKNKLQKNIIKF